MSIQLDRLFSPWDEERESDSDFSQWLPDSRSLHWRDLLEKRRVVILAEAGSGKSTELEAEAKKKEAEGCVTFKATLQDIGERTFIAAIGRDGPDRLEQWKKAQGPAWLFLDSVDEAKASGVRLARVLAEVAEHIRGVEGRAHIVISGRPSDWELRRDFELLNQHLPLPPPDRAPPTFDPDELMIRTLRHERPKAQNVPKAETAVVVLMAPLTKTQVELFAKEKGIRDLSKFLAAIEHANLWQFARRPLDLDWLVSYWIEHGEFGRLEEMLALSLRERLKETDVERDQASPLALDRSVLALERVGAALVLQRLKDIVVPDSTPLFDRPQKALDLEGLLPDWSGEDRRSLMRRPVFDPARRGFVRLHNDNQGVVRGYLAAKWLNRRKKAGGASHASVARLLFAQSHGVAVVRPSMKETAAWLSIWDSAVAQDVIERDPFLLMDAGDPGSLPVAVRRMVLQRVVARVAEDDQVDLPDQDSLKRFATPDLADDVRELWQRYSMSRAARVLLLSMIWRGEIKQCADVAKAAAGGVYNDGLTEVFAGRALIAAGNAAFKAEYAEHIKSHAATLSTTVVSEGIEELFPAIVNVEDVLDTLHYDTLLKGTDHRRLKYLGPRLVSKIDDPDRAHRFLSGLINLGNAGKPNDDNDGGDDDDPFASTVEACARKLVQLSHRESDLTLAIDALVYSGRSSRYHSKRSEEVKEVIAAIQSTPQRRRRAVWRLAELFPTASGGGPLNQPWQLEYKARYFPRLEREDLDWLLEDVAQRTLERDRVLATNAVMGIWAHNDKDPAILGRIESLAARDTSVRQAIEQLITPPKQSSEEQKVLRDIARLEKRNAAENAKADQSWIEFADRLRAEPDQLRELPAPGKDGVDSRLYHVWQLVHAIGFNENRYAVDDLSPLRPILGDAVLSAARDAFTKFWREWQPRLRVEKPSEERSTINALDCMGIVGVSLEAAAAVNWATHLSEAEAELAARYATLELNGYPRWIVPLADSHPEAVRSVLLQLLAPELSDTKGGGTEALKDIAVSDDKVVSLVATHVFDRLSQATEIPEEVLAPALKIVVRGLRDREALNDLLRARFRVDTRVGARAGYAAALFALDPQGATSELVSAVDRLAQNKRADFVQAILPSVFGDHFTRSAVDPRSLPFESVKALIELAYRTVRIAEDEKHKSGVPYTPTARDHAENARSALFNVLVNTPGYATYRALHEYAEKDCLGIERKHLLRLAAQRAAEDSETAPWKASDILDFERDALTVPATARDLRAVLVNRLDDLKHEMFHGDFLQAVTVARLGPEVEVQRWFAQELRNRAGPSYSIEREVHVAGEKEPDLRARTKSKDASVPVELKVVESWTLKKLEDALVVQLIGRYLRAKNDRYGILLLVHKQPKPRGWENAQGKRLSFAEVVDHLRDMADEIARVSPDSAQVEVVSVDVARYCETPIPNDKGNSKKSQTSG